MLTFLEVELGVCFAVHVESDLMCMRHVGLVRNSMGYKILSWCVHKPKSNLGQPTPREDIKYLQILTAKTPRAENYLTKSVISFIILKLLDTRNSPWIELVTLWVEGQYAIHQTIRKLNFIIFYTLTHKLNLFLKVYCKVLSNNKPTFKLIGIWRGDQLWFSLLNLKQNTKLYNCEISQKCNIVILNLKSETKPV